MKKKINIVLFAVEAIIIVLFLLPLFKPNVHYEYNFDQMISYTEIASKTEDGYYIDASSGYKGIFTYKPYFTLERGAYRITINYETDGTDNTCIISSNSYKSFNSIRCEEILLSPNLTSMTFNAYLQEDVSAINLITNYNGSGSLLIKSASISRTHDMERVDLFIAVIAIIIINVIVFFKNNGIFSSMSREQVNVLYLLAGAVIFSSYPLFTLGVTRGSDLVFHLLRIEGLKDGLLSGMFPVRIQPTWMEGYGYAVSVFYGDLLLYFPAILRIIGFSIQGAYKIFLFVINIATCLTAYYCLKKIVKNRYAAAFGSALYLLAPFRLYGMYVVSRVGESSALIFIPLIVSGLYCIFTKNVKDKDYKKSYIAPMIGYAGLINCHVLTTQIAVFFTLMVCILGIVRVFQKERFWELFKTAAFSLLISAAFIIPFLDYYLGYEFHVNSEQESQWIQEAGLQLSQLMQIFPSSNDEIQSFTGLSYNGIENAGIVVFVLVIVFLYVMTIVKKRDKKTLIPVWVMYGLGVLAGIMTTCYFPWDIIRKKLWDHELEVIIDSIQRPTRLMPVAAILIIAAGCYALKLLIENKEGRIIGWVIIGSCVVLTVVQSGYYNNYVINNKAQETITDLGKYAHMHTWSRGEYLPPNTDTSYLTAIGVAPGENVEISDYDKEYLDVRFTAVNNSDQASYVDLPLVYYGGYMAKDDNGNLMNVYNGHNNNVLRVDIPSDYTGNIHVYFREPLSWRASEAVSFLMVLLIAGYYVLRKKTRHE